MPDYDTISSLPKLTTIMDNKDVGKKRQEIKKQQDGEINDETDLQRLNDEINSGEIPKEIEFCFEEPNQNFSLMCSNLNLSRENSDFIDFSSSDIGRLVHKFSEKICFQFTLKPVIFSMIITIRMNQYMIFYWDNKTIKKKRKLMQL